MQIKQNKTIDTTSILSIYIGHRIVGATGQWNLLFCSLAYPHSHTQWHDTGLGKFINMHIFPSPSFQMLENQMDVRKKEIEELQSQAQALSQEGKSTDEVDGKRLIVEKKFVELLEPLNERKSHLLASKEIHQFNRDVEDEIVSLKYLLMLRPNCKEFVTSCFLDHFQ